MTRHLPFEHQTPQQVVEAVVVMSPGDLESSANKMTIEQLVAVFASLNEKHGKGWKDKIRATFRGVNNESKLEAISRLLTCHQALEILEEDPTKLPAIKLSPLFVGLSHQAFAEMVISANEEQLRCMQHEATKEPIQHQLTCFLHELEQEEQACTAALQELEKKIHAIVPINLTRLKLQEIYQELGIFSERIDESIHRIDKGLSIAWNSDRIDLVDRLSQLKEYYLSDSRVGLGHRREGGRAPTGLFAKLEKHLHVVYGAPNSPDVLKDEDPANEALAKLSVWYLTDYWKLGLLPGIMSEAQLEGLKSSSNPELRGSYQEKLRHHALENLRRTGLETVRDFKTSDIYSRAMLMEYLSDHSQRLRPVHMGRQERSTI